MTVNRYDPEIHHRRTIRLKGHDYSSAGAYFVTVCTQEHERLFGGITDNVMLLSDAGRVVETLWRELPDRFHNVLIDEFVVMPNHFHGIIVITNEIIDKTTVGALLAAPPFAAPLPPHAISGKQGAASSEIKKGAASSARTLGQIMRAFKSISAISVNRILDRCGRPLWQRNYYERIIRDERELDNIREYIINNPARWDDDPENRT